LKINEVSLKTEIDKCPPIEVRFVDLASDTITPKAISYM